MKKYILLLLLTTNAYAKTVDRHSKPPEPTRSQFNLNYNNTHTTKAVYQSFTAEQKRLWRLSTIILEYEDLKLTRKTKGDGICYQETVYLKSLKIATPSLCANAFLDNRIKPADIKIRNIFKNININQEAGLISYLYRTNIANFNKNNKLYKVLTRIYKKHYFTKFSKKDKIDIMREWYFIVPRHINEARFLRLIRNSDEKCKIVGAFDCYGGWINRADMELRSFFNVKQEELDKLKEFL
jgi:hypothetical protein